MKKLLAVILTFVFLVGCGSDKNENTQDEMSEAQSFDSEKMISDDVVKEKLFELSYNFPKGKKLRYKLTSVATTDQKIESDTVINQEVTQTIDYLFDIESFGKVNDNYKLKVSIKSIKLTTNFNGETLSFDSENIENNSNQKDYAEYASLANTSYDITIDRQGTILSVDNIEEIIDNYLRIQEIPSITDEERTEFREQMKSNAIQPLTQQMFKYLPDKRIKINSPWTLNYESDLGVYKLKNTATSIFKGIQKDNEDSIAVIKTDLSVIPEGNGSITQNNINYQFSEPKVTGFAHILFNIEEGYIVQSESTSQTEMNLFVTNNDATTGPQTATRSDFAVNKNYLELLSAE